ncbi:MAG: alpha/beta hydrolase [Acidimicrobiales bacterium]
MSLADTPIRLWDGKAPSSEDWAHHEIFASDLPGGYELVRNVTVPTLTPFTPDHATNRAVIVLPGGAFHFLAVEHEGRAVAEFIRRSGSASFVLKYRVVPTPADSESYAQALVDAFTIGIHDVASRVVPLAIADAQRALELVRSQGFEHITMMGFSAGARITSRVLFQGDSEVRPDAAALCYLPSVDQCNSAPDSPPLFVMAAADDPLGVEGSFAVTDAWRTAGASVEFHLFDLGGHGFGAGPSGLPLDVWPELFLAWHGSVSTR